MTWLRQSIGDLAIRVTKGTTPTTLGYSFAEAGIPFVRVQNLVEGKVDLSRDPLFIDEETHEVLERSQIQKGDLLISIAGTIGRPAIADIDSPLNCNQAVAIVRFNGTVDRKYVLFWLATPDALRQMSSKGVTATITNLSLTQIKSLQIPLPPLAEQKRIARILDAADALRAKRRESLAQLDTLLQSTFLDMFGDPRREGSTGKAETKPLRMGKLTRIRTGKLDANAADEDGEYPFFTCAVNTLRINDAAYDAKAVLVAGNGDLNVKYYEGKFNAYQRTYVIESENESTLHPRFLHIFLDLYVSELRKQAIGGVIKYIKLPYLKDAMVQLPDPESQHHFATIVKSVEQQKATQRAHLAELDTLFASLQSRAFRGAL